MPSPGHAALIATSQGHKRGTSWFVYGVNSTICRRPMDDLHRFGFFRLVSEHSRSLFNQNAAVFVDVFSCSEEYGDSTLHGMWADHKVEASLSAVVVLLLHCVLFFCMCVGSKSSYTVFKFRRTHSKHLKIFCPVTSDIQTKCEILLLILCSRHFMNAVFPSHYISFHWTQAQSTCSSNLLLSTTHADDPLNCWASSSDFSVYHADFHEGRGCSVGAWQWRSTARPGHGMVCVWISEIWHGILCLWISETRHGMACVN